LLLAGAAGGAGTSVWLSGKLSQEFQAPFDRTVSAAKSSLRMLRFDIIKETVEKEVAQIISKSREGKNIWIDVRFITDTRTKVEVRVGAVKPDTKTAEKILQRIERSL